MAANKIPVRYVGLKRHEADHLYGSNVGFTKGRVSLVPDWAAARLLKHPEFEDARPEPQRGTPIVAEREFSRDEVDREREELDALAAHVRIEPMTKDQLSAHVMRTYGVHLSTSHLKADMIDQATNLMRMRGIG